MRNFLAQREAGAEYSYINSSQQPWPFDAQSELFTCPETAEPAIRVPSDSASISQVVCTFGRSLSQNGCGIGLTPFAISRPDLLALIWHSLVRLAPHHGVHTGTTTAASRESSIGGVCTCELCGQSLRGRHGSRNEPRLESVPTERCESVRTTLQAVSRWHVTTDI
jgi:hypothetical protein